MRVICSLLTALLLCLPFWVPRAAAAPADDGVWRSVSSTLLTVRYRGQSDVFANQVLERTGVFLTDTSQFLGLPWVSQYFVVIARSKEEFVELQPGTRPAPEWAGALTYPGLKMVLIMTPGSMRTGGSSYWSLLQHETAHLLLGDAQARHGTRLPRWFEEGVATYVSGEMNISRLLQLGWAQATGATPDFKDLEFTFPSQSSRAGAAYARSYLFIKYLTRRFGEDAVARLLMESFQRGGISSGAAAAFGIPLSDLLEGFDQYARVKATWVPVGTSTATIWAFITMLFFITWFRKKVQGMRTVRQWEREEEIERLAASLHSFKNERSQEDRSREKNPTLH
jgi:hypothetical protein